MLCYASWAGGQDRLGSNWWLQTLPRDHTAADHTVDWSKQYPWRCISEVSDFLDKEQGKERRKEGGREAHRGGREEEGEEGRERREEGGRWGERRGGGRERELGRKEEGGQEREPGGGGGKGGGEGRGGRGGWGGCGGDEGWETESEGMQQCSC